VSQSSDFCCHNPLCCFSMSGYCWCLFRYGLSPETFGYTLVKNQSQNVRWSCACAVFVSLNHKIMKRALIRCHLWQTRRNLEQLYTETHTEYTVMMVLMY